MLREYILCTSESGGLFPLGAGRESILSTSGPCGFSPLGARRELILSTFLTPIGNVRADAFLHRADACNERCCRCAEVASITF